MDYQTIQQLAAVHGTPTLFLSEARLRENYRQLRAALPGVTMYYAVKSNAAPEIVSILSNEGVRHIFGIPGAGILPFYKSMQKDGRIKHLIARHEEGAIHMADGYARAINTVGVCAATSGPGASNFVTGLYTAQVDSILFKEILVQ